MKTVTLGLGPDRTGAVLLAGGDRIVRFGFGERPDPAPRAWIPCEDARLEPGKVNAHTHIYSGLAPLGMPPPVEPPENFVQILERVWWRLDRALDENALRASARFYVAEALLAGTTVLVDHHESPSFIEGSLDVLADVCQELGMRAVLCYGATERNGGRDEARQGLEECRRFIRSNRRPLVRGAVGLHASFTVSDETLHEAGELCRELDTVMHVHMAEDRADVEDAVRRGYAGPLERLLKLDALPAGSILAHGVHLDAEQVRAADDRGLWLVQNPRSNQGNRVGYPRGLAASSRVALGTDGYPARMVVEELVLADQAKGRGENADVVWARMEAGLEMAAERFGVRFSPLEEETAADVAARLDEVELRHLVVAGHEVVRDGRLLTADMDAIRADAEAEAGRLWKRMASL